MRNFAEILNEIPLFYFGKGRPRDLETSWFDKGKYTFKCSGALGVPGSFDQDCYTAVICLWIRKGKPVVLDASYSEIAQCLSLKPQDWVSRVKKSLVVLSHVKYQISIRLITWGNNLDVKFERYSFSLFESLSLYNHKGKEDKRSGKIYITIPNKISNNLDTTYYEFLDIKEYRSIPQGLPRRLYEYLLKNFEIGPEFELHSDDICRVLPVRDRNASARRRRLEKVFTFLRRSGVLLTYKRCEDSHRFAICRRDRFSPGEILSAWKDDSVSDYVQLSKELTTTRLVQ